MSQRRVLIIDDSIVYRRLLREALEQHEGIDIVGSASSGAAGLRVLSTVVPDIVITERALADKQSAEIMKTVMERAPNARIIVFSTSLPHLGSNEHAGTPKDKKEYVAKPEAQDLALMREAVQKDLVPRVLNAMADDTGSEKKQSDSKLFIRQLIDIIVIGASTGGPEAIKALIGKLPLECYTPIVIAQHMPVAFTDRLIESLDAASSLQVRRAVDGEILSNNCITVIPGGMHMRLKGTRRQPRITLEQAENTRMYCPSVDKLFESAADIFGTNTLGVILTGMGKDGLEGAKTIRSHNGVVVAQDPASSTVWGMPGMVAEAGLANLVISTEEIHRVLRHLLMTQQPDYLARHSSNESEAG